MYGFGSATGSSTGTGAIGTRGSGAVAAAAQAAAAVHYYNKSDAAARADPSRTAAAQRHHWGRERRCAHQVLPRWLGPHKFRMHV